ncbi:MAG TPA: TIGR03086 family metal-binding protein [Sporichthyaceae bacterium]|jgi:uncharacterized protein (TIGR03086 family)|nr:TIGR03086 family metal-binding protein [Sporichthyaceae bacterium]
MDPVANIHETAAEMNRLMSSLSPESVGRPTPCAGWTAADLVEHVTANPYGFAEWAGDDRHVPVPASADPDRTAGERYGAAIWSVLCAYTATGVLDKDLPTPFGDRPGAVVLAVCFADQLTHLWDLAYALGAPVTVPDRLAQDAIDVWTAFIEQPLRNGDTFADPVDIHPAAPALDRLAAFTGRDPGKA